MTIKTNAQMQVITPDNGLTYSFRMDEADLFLYIFKTRLTLTPVSAILWRGEWYTCLDLEEWDTLLNEKEASYKIVYVHELSCQDT